MNDLEKECRQAQKVASAERTKALYLKEKLTKHHLHQRMLHSENRKLATDLLLIDVSKTLLAEELDGLKAQSLVSGRVLFPGERVARFQMSVWGSVADLKTEIERVKGPQFAAGRTSLYFANRSIDNSTRILDLCGDRLELFAKSSD